MAYILDANVLIQAKNLHYGLDFCPAFWEWLVINNSSGKVSSIEKVEDEILAGSDELSDWAKKRGNKFFLRPEPDLPMSLTKVSTWVTEQNYEPAAINTFLQMADYYIIAQALSGKHTVVTHEIPSNSTKKIKIPDVCMGLKIKVMNPYQMLRHEKASFVLGKKYE